MLHETDIILNKICIKKYNRTAENLLNFIGDDIIKKKKHVIKKGILILFKYQGVKDGKIM